MTGVGTRHCKGCNCELSPRDVREIVVHGEPHGSLCERCAEEASSMSFADWLDMCWQRDHPH
jgi:hypothetical protein